MKGIVQFLYKHWGEPELVIVFSINRFEFLSFMDIVYILYDMALGIFKI